jgi:predicted DNA-binding protein YlxM (UPF0122 family)
MTCENCSKRANCTEPCQKIKGILDKESKKFTWSYWHEFCYSNDTIEYIFTVKHHVGQNTLLETISPTLNEDNMIFIKYLIDNHLPIKQSNMLTDYFFNGMKQRQIAEKYNIKQPTVFFHIRQGLRSLRFMVKSLLGD